MASSYEELTADRKLLVETAFARGSKMELSLSCSDIPRMDVLSKSDPFCVMYIRNREEQWQKLGKTETIRDTHECKWVRKFYLRDTATVGAEMRIEVYDRDSERDTLTDHDFIGYVEGRVVLGMVAEEVGHVGLELCRAKGGEGKYGKLFVTMDWVEKPLINYNVRFEVRVEGKGSIGRVFYQIVRRTFLESQYVVVYRSEVSGKGCAMFEEACMRLSLLGAGCRGRTFRIEVLEFRGMGRSRVLGYVKTNLDELSWLGHQKELRWHASGNGLENARVLAWMRHDSPRSGKTFVIAIEMK